ncbi:hypothetical protein BRADI_5g16181v3 [Brachypodium distachyon]|uniref:Serpin domain-containing protein n=1 Tax=Brachypodium distachyon TaxID=15368 RepID=A0A2K2CHK9_BRADI|nr:hypothetical protein BRADI_5g16181v3 [Brachypodium distachyon]
MGSQSPYSGGLAAFAAGLGKRLADETADSNLVFSPLSIYAAFALLAPGARGPTLDEILRVLGAPSRGGLEDFVSLMAEGALSDQSGAGGPCVAFACGVWSDLSRALKPAYRAAVAGTCNNQAEARAVDFRGDPAGSRAQINKWAARATRGLIDSVLGPGSITPLTRVVLGNAVYSKGKWEKPFQEKWTTKEPFYRLDGSNVETPFMQSGSSQYIAVHHGFKVLKLRYKMAKATRTGSRGKKAQVQTAPSGHRIKSTLFSMCIFLPDDKDGLRNLVGMVESQPGFRHKHLPKEKVYVNEFRVPKFKLSFHSSVVVVLKKLGLELPFGDRADLSEMVEDDGSGLLMVQSDVVHKAVIVGG